MKRCLVQFENDVSEKQELSRQSSRLICENKESRRDPEFNSTSAEKDRERERIPTDLLLNGRRQIEREKERECSPT